MKNKKLFMISVVACFVPIILGLLFYSQLPKQLPIHWNAAGEVDSYASKVFALFGIPTILLIFHVVLVWITSKDPKHRNTPKIMYGIIYFLIPIISTICVGFSINTALPNGLDINISITMPVVLGIIFIFVGNYLPKCKQSYTVGIKTPWALDDEDNWNKTHRLAGFLWMIGGILIVISGLFISSMATPFITIIIVMTVIPYVYSYLIYKKKGQ